MALPPWLKVSPAYISWVLNTNRAIMGHLYQFTQPVLGLPPTGAVWFRLNGGDWYGNGVGDPVANVNGITLGPLGLPMFPFCGVADVFSGTSSVTLNTGGSAFAYTPPTGAAPLGGTWNPLDASAGLHDGNLTASAGAIANQGARGTVSPSSIIALLYFEATIVFGTTATCVGLANADVSLNTGHVGGISVVVDANGDISGTFGSGNIGTPVSGDTIGIAVLYTIPPQPVGPSDYFTDLDQDVTYAGQTWKSGSLRFEGLQRKLSVGLAVDEQNLKIWAAPTDTLFGANFLENAQDGLLDGVSIVRYRIIWQFVTGNASVDIKNTPIAVWPLFTGYTSTIAKGGASHVELKVKSALVKLNVNMPRNYYQAGCGWTLFDQGCTLSKAAFAVNGTIDSGPTALAIPVSGGVSPDIGADGIPYFAQGRLMFTSGVNNGLQVLIDSNDGTNLYLAYPLNSIPSAGDTITFFPGCSKTYVTCDQKFNNKANFRGFDKVPPIQISA